ncbi:H-NS histone family protein [Comamonas jiangduensis]|jgi:DNA-binding protein H-NS|uniref:H-NS histone family protein n=1 Tax=Comamonas jiangduensis TaxID=1194168 RepID=A0ABV4IBJ9_9BURK|nr:H-NS histone family protein [Comamonas jiangduensis]
MTQYQELLARKRELDKTIEQIRRTESAAALKTVHELIATFGFTAQQVFPFQPVQKKKVQAKYYDPETGLSWTGRGKAPKWIEGKDRTAYEIAAPRTEPASQSAGQASDSGNPFPIQ